MSAPPHSQKPASAAAMDALDLDDLFLEGDDGPSLFADMEIDLGDMGNIFDAPGGAAAAAAAAGGGPSGPTASYHNQRGGGDMLSQEFGRPSSAGSNRGKRVRTAKTNPHLLAAAAAEQEGGTESAQKRQSAIQKELQRLQDSNEMVIDSKRKRRRSKKNQDDNNEDANQKKEAEAAAAGKVASKKKRRNSSKTNTQQTELPPPQQTQPHLQQQQQALQQIFHQMNPQQKERLQKKAEAMGLNIFAASSTSPSPQSQSQTNNLINQQENIADCGLQPSTTFYPFCALPPELDIKRGQKVFPVLEKINATSAPSSHHHHANTDDDQAMHASASTLITASSPLYTLFHQHLGLIQNSDRGISDLAEAVKLTNTSMTREGGKKKTAQELSKLLTQCLKQSVFIKQNLSNLESFVKGGEASWNDADIQSLFPDKNATADTSAAASSLPSGGGIMATNNKDKTSPASKRGTPNASSTQAHGSPMISVKVKVRVPGWRDKSGARLVAKLSCPPGWKAAMNRENLKVEAKKASSENVPSPASTTTTKSTASRKRKAKESSASVSATNKSAASSANRGSSSKIAVPFVSVHQDKQETTSKQNQEHQDPSILHNLFTKILRPSISPAQRRELLANEISSTLSRLENARVTQQWTKARKIQGQMKALQSIYKDDIDIVPDMCNTIGMWRWMEHTNYFKDIEEEGEVYQELEDCLHEEKDEEVFESKGSILEEGTLWGSNALSEMRRVSTASTDDNEDDKDDTDGMNDDIEPSPLFDRLQSLLVEVDGSDDEEDDDDDDVIASLPQFSSDQFINGPAGDNDSDKNMIDVSALTLDQRTYIQLRAAGLVDATAPPSSVLKRALPAASTSDNKDCQSIDRILNKMKMRLSNLQSESNNTKVTALQRKALLHVRQAPERKQRERDEEAVLTKYKQLQKIQKEQKEEKKRSSSRARAGSD